MATNTESPISQNTQDFSNSDDEILDNFADGPDPNDDGTPIGLGGEKGKQSEPASSTLESDIVNGTTKQPGETLPSETSAGEQEPVQEPAGETGPETSPEPDSEEPETSFPPALLQMAGYADAAAAQADGIGSPEALYAYVRGRGQLLSPVDQPPVQPDVYQRPAQPPIPAPQSPETPVEGDFKPFELPPEKMDMLDEDLQEVLRNMNEHYQQEVKSLRSSVGQREAELARQRQMEEVSAFDNAVQSLGEVWQDVFGEGSGTELARNGQRDPVALTNFNHRSMLFEAVQSVRDVNAKRGFKPMDLNQEIQFALMQRYPDKFQQTISGSSNSGQRRGVTASRPTQRNTPPKSQNEKVLSDVNAMLKKRHGYSLDMGQEEEFEGEI